MPIQNNQGRMWSGWANAYRTAALDPDVCSVERGLALKAAVEPPVTLSAE